MHRMQMNVTVLDFISFISLFLQKKEEKMETKYLNFSDTVYGCCTERQHHYFLSHIDDW